MSTAMKSVLVTHFSRKKSNVPFPDGIEIVTLYLGRCVPTVLYSYFIARDRTRGWVSCSHKHSPGARGDHGNTDVNTFCLAPFSTQLVTAAPRHSSHIPRQCQAVSLNTRRATRDFLLGKPVSILVIV